MRNSQPKKYLIFVEHYCPVSVDGNPARCDVWREYESEHPPKVGMRLNDCCSGGIHPFESCDEEDTRCEETGIVTKVEEYTEERFMELIQNA